MCAYMFKTHQEARFWDLQCLCALLFSSFPWAFRVIVNLSFLHRKWALGNGGLWYAQLLGGRERIWKSVSWCRKDSHPMPFPPNWSDNSELTLLREASGRREQMRRCDVGCSDQHRAKSKMTAQPISFPVASKKWQHQRAQTEDSGHIVLLDLGWIRFLSTCFFSLLNSTAWHCAGPCASCSWWGKWGGRVCWEQAEQLASPCGISTWIFVWLCCCEILGALRLSSKATESEHFIHCSVNSDGRAMEIRGVWETRQLSQLSL